MLPVQRTDIALLRSSGACGSEDAFATLKLKRPKLSPTCRSMRTSLGSPSKRVFVQYSACSPEEFGLESGGVRTDDGTRGGPGSRSAAETGSVPSAYSIRIPSPTRWRMPSRMLTRYVGRTRELPPPAM